MQIYHLMMLIEFVMLFSNKRENNERNYKKWGVQTLPKVRNSNLELFRILTMISIVAHHYVVNSGLMATDGVITSK